jgi:rod shape determining protein RodA
MNYSFHHFFKKPNYLFLITLILLLLFGSVFIYSASSSLGSSHTMLMKHLIFIGLGILLFFIIVLSHKDFVQDLAYPVYGFCIFLLLILLVTKLTGNPDDVHRWIQIGRFQLFQPSEFMKIGLIMALSKTYSMKKMKPFHMYLIGGILTVVPVLLVLIQPDLGTASVILFIYFIMTFFSTLGIKYILLTFVSGSVLFIPFRKFLIKPYQIQRFQTLVNLLFHPEKIDLTGEGWSIMQALIAIGSGGLFGKGLGKGTQSKMRFLPDTKYSDFIFAVIGEEIGFFGCILLLVLFLFLLMASINLIFYCDNYFDKMLLTGISAYWFVQIFTNIGMNISLLPVTGIPLPFISYGGSALLTNMIAAGLVYHAYMNRKKLGF